MDGIIKGGCVALLEPGVPGVPRVLKGCPIHCCPQKTDGMDQLVFTIDQSVYVIYKWKVCIHECFLVS